MPTATIELSAPHTKQRMILEHPARFKVAACGRRFGKSELGKQALARVALAGGVAWWISPSYPMASQAWKSLKQMLYPVIVSKNEVERSLELVTGGTIQVKSGHDPDSLRGAGLDLAVLDEAAYMHPDVWQAAIRPALADKRGGALFLSTPNGRNWFWGLYMQGQDPHQHDWASWRLPTSSSPTVHPDEIEDARLLLPERMFKQEFLAEFTEDGGAVFRNITACITVQELAGPVDGDTYTFGVDWGKSNDFTVIAVMNQRGELVKLERFNEIGWSLQRGRLTALAHKWNPNEIWAETNSIGGPNVEALQADGLPVVGFETTATSKGPLIESLALALERGEIALYNDPVLIGELQAYTLERLPSGRYRYNAPAGMHDDTVIALALGWHGVQSRGIGITFYSGES